MPEADPPPRINAGSRRREESKMRILIRKTYAAARAWKGATMQRRVLLAAALLALVAVPAAAAQTVSLEASFKESFGRADAHPCPLAFACGRGEVEGFGAATSTFEILSFENLDPETSCGDATIRYTITLTSGAGTLVLTETGVACFPGKSPLAPGSLKSFGNPSTLTATWTVTGGTGVFAGASGSGSSTAHFAGDAGQSTLSGTITLS
jgi:hypothetical protein